MRHLLSGELTPARVFLKGSMEYFTDPKQLLPAKIISLDTEYSELDIKKARLLSISVGTSSERAGVFTPAQLPQISSVIQNADIIFTQNGAVDYWVLKRHGLLLNPARFMDCMLMEHLLDENIGHSLGEMALRYCGDDYKAQFWSTLTSYEEGERSAQLDYEMRDACYTYKFGLDFYERISNKELIQHVHQLYWSLFWTEVEGLPVDVPLMVQTEAEMRKQIEAYLPKLRHDFIQNVSIWELSQWQKEIEKRVTDKGKSGVKRPTFNFASGDQVGWLVYDSLGCPVLEKTKKGSPKTDYDTFVRLAQDHPKLQTLVDYKGIKGIYATFVKGMLERVEGGRIYPSFNVNGTRNAGRISHSNPNMGNMPQEGPIRNFFLPNEGCALVGADYSQLEVVIEANLTEDKSLLKIILEGASKHDITAQGLGITRNDAKTLNFALQYGAGVHKVSKLLKISQQEAEGVFKKYWEIYSGVKSLKDRTALEIERSGFVTTLFGRHRHFPKPKNEYEKARFERQAYNAIIQGTGADCTNRATWKISELLRSKKLGRMLFSVHDEILIEAKKGECGNAIDELVLVMMEPSDYLKLKYPLGVKPYGPLSRWAKT